MTRNGKTEPQIDSEEKLYRLQMDFTPNALKQFQKLQDILGHGTKAETARYAFRLTQWLVNFIEENPNLIVNFENLENQDKLRIPGQFFLNK